MLKQDIRYAIRSLLKNPAFTAIAVACLALGIGVNSTIFSVVDGVILSPTPYPEADRIVAVSSTNPKENVRRGGLSYADFKDYRDSNTTMASLAAFTERSLTIADSNGDPERYRGATISWNLFPLLGVAPVAGRSFVPEEDRPGAEPVVLLSHEVWERRYQKDPAIVGRAINVNGRPHNVVGVMPPRFLFPENHRLWVPVASYQESTPRDQRGLQVFARMKPGVTLQQADADLNGLAARLAKTYPIENENWGTVTRSLSQWMLPDDVKLVVLTMMGAATLVLLIACSNVANLLLARASARQREISIRAALGAGRWRIVRQLLTEAVLIGLLSAPLGIAIAWIGIKMLDSSMPPDEIPYFIRWSLNSRSLAVHHRGVDVDRDCVRPGPGVSGGAQQPAEQSQGRRSGHRRRFPCVAAQYAGRRRSRAVAGAARRRVAVRAQLHEPSDGERWLRHRTADDAAVLPAWSERTRSRMPRHVAWTTSFDASRRCPACRRRSPPTSCRWAAAVEAGE